MCKEIIIKADPKDINYINRIMEGHEYLGLVTTKSREKGQLVIRSTPDTYSEAIKILENIGLELEFI